jgi:2-polyprenyl-6-methoxyphenol hydroxylase-like FAD-dependent oxidoreductase
MANTGAKIVVLGGGVCGLATGVMLARDGHEVTLLERDPSPVPDSPEDAWESWDRSGVTQFHQPHYLQPRAREVLDDCLPDVTLALMGAGAVAVNPLKWMPPTISEQATRPGDERLTTVTGRRSTVEFVFATAAGSEPGLNIRRGVSVAGLSTRNVEGTPHVTGVLNGTGEELSADLVVDAMGRRSSLPAWLDAAGCGTPAEEAEDSGFIYYTRYFRRANGGDAPIPRSALLTPIGCFSILTLPSDRDTWSVTLFVASGDQPLKDMRHTEVFEAVVRACPLHAHWLDGEPITEVLAMGGVIDRYRSMFPNGAPVATGIAPVADAWACTNPSLGRGISLGLLHAQHLRDTVREQVDDPRAFAEAWHDATERELSPWYRATVALDRARLAEIDAIRSGVPVPPPRDWEAAARAALPLAMGFDPDIFRAGLEIFGCLSLPDEVFARSGLAERVIELAEQYGGSLGPLPGPDRDQLLEIVTDARSAARS